VTHPALIEKRKGKTKSIQLIQNAADYDYFKKANSIIKEQKSKVIVGYFGNLEWLDWEIIDNVAKTYGKWEFVFTGPGNHPPNLHENIKFTGMVSYQNLCAVLAQWDICWIPFKDCETIRHTNPIKIYEYLSAGKPTVVTKVIGFDSDLVYQAYTSEEYIEALYIASIEHDEALKKSRIDYAKTNSWDARVSHINELLMKIKR
jgi:glycosyltransferase involved in cell wall biosynthesis